MVFSCHYGDVSDFLSIRKGEMVMCDKYHNEWIIRDRVTDCRIFEGQSRAFHFLSDMSNTFNGAIEMLKGIKYLSVMSLELDMLERKLLYLKMANGIGRCFCKNEVV